MKNFTILQQCYARKLKEVEIREENINKMSGTVSKKNIFGRFTKKKRMENKNKLGNNKIKRRPLTYSVVEK